MADAGEPPQRPTMDGSATSPTSSSSDHAMEDGQSASPSDGVASWKPLGSESASSSTHARPVVNGNTGRKRKVPAAITPNACTNCKKARAKCDGAKPSCTRCSHRHVTESCHYEVHAKTAKEQMVREIQRLQRKNESLEEEKDTLDEKNSWVEQIVQSIKDDDQGPEIISRLKRGQPHQAIAAWLRQPSEDGESKQGLSERTRSQLSQAIEQYHKSLVENHDPRFWTSTTQDPQLIEHLIKLYLTWIHPVHMLFDERHFLSSFRQCMDVYCSSALVNTICAMSCHLLHSVESGSERTRAATEKLRRDFLKEAQRLLETAERNKMTTVQSYAIMFLTEFSSGHGLIAASHLRLATETLVDKQHSEQSEESERVAAWGILTLHTLWSGFTYQKPQAPISTKAYPFEGTILDFERDGNWQLYKQPSDGDMPQRPNLSVLTASEHAKLFRIVHETLLVYCAGRGKVTGQHLFDLYQRYTHWKNELPQALQDLVGEPLPHVMFLHIQYNTALIHLLQPLLHLHSDSVQRESLTLIRSLLVHHARAGLQLLAQYRNTYTSSYISPLQLLCLLHICDVLIRYDDSGESTSRIIHFCFTSLQDAKNSYAIAGPFQKMFRDALAEYNQPVPDELERMIGASAALTPEALLESCTRVTFKQPMFEFLPNMYEDAGEGFARIWRQDYEQGGPSGGGRRTSFASSGNKNRMDIRALLNS